MNRQVKLPQAELITWIVAILALAFSTPGKIHFTLCPLAALGIHWCPGCGLGRSIAAVLHGDIRRSWQEHWFGIPALGILLHRMLELSKIYLQSLRIST